MRIAIIDDSNADREMIISNLAAYFKEAGEKFTYYEYNNADDFLKDYEFTFDCIIFDIDMPGISGIEAANILRKKDPNVILMFVTNMPQYALDGYAVDAVDYVLKPLSYPDFRMKMKKVARYVARNSGRRITIKTSTEITVINTSEIIYIESRLHYIYYHTTKAVYKTRAKISDVEDILLPYHFARSSASYLVNLAYLEKIDGNEITVHGERLPVSRSMKSLLLSAFAKYMGGM